MSTHLLYRKDLPNHTLARTLLFALAQLLAFLVVLTQATSPAEAAGALSVKTTKSSYFVDSKGNPVYLTGSYLNEYNLLSGSWDFASYLDFLQQQNQNFTRVWGWEQSPWAYDNTGQISFATQPYQRTGPGLALDGGLKFDLTRFDQAYFDQLRSRVVYAAQRGIYVSVMLFEGFSTQKKIGRLNPWLGDPFQQVNNINGINGDPNRNGSNEELFSLAYPSLLALQEAFVRKVIDTLNDLDNVLYEINGNGLAGSLTWQYHMIDYIRRYEKKTGNQHPVGISDFYAGATADVFNSSADWIVIQESNLNPLSSTKKILIVEGTPPSSNGQVPSTSPIALVQLLPDSVISSQSSVSSNDLSSNGVTLLSSSTTSSTLASTQNSSNNQQSQVAIPTISPNGGVYSGKVAVTLQTTTPGASIYYTTDGQSPTQSSRQYSGKFTLSESTLVKAKAFKNNLEPSSEASAWFANATSQTGGGSGLVAHWKFDEGSGTTVADSSGNGNTGTLVNGPLWTAGRVGNALYFDGINDNVRVPDSSFLDLTNSFTVSAWVNPASTFTDYRAIVAKNHDQYYLYASSTGLCGNGSPYGDFLYNGRDIAVCQPSPLPINTWTHLTVTYTGSMLTLYRDGVAVATSTASGTLSPNTETLQIGASDYGEYFKGLIDEVRIYNKALTATEIQTIYQQDSAAPVQTVAMPAISPNGGSYSNSVPVNMQTATSGASIYYTTDGSSPTQSSTLYAGTMTLTSSATVKAKAFKSGYNPSAEASALFTVTQPFNFSLANSGDKSVVAGSSVTNSISTTLVSGNTQAVAFSASGLPTGATASFSSTSCNPACSSTLTINTTGSTPAGSSTTTVTATGGNVSKTTTFALTVNPPPMATVATPTINPNGGSFSGSASVTMQTATSGASIYYTTNGTTPTQSSTPYNGAINLTSSATVKAKAFKSGYIASAESSAAFTVTTPLITTWTFCALENSPCNFSGTKEVRYGTNGVYVSQIFSNGVFCDNNIFGDPVFGWGKQCEYRDVSNPLTVAIPTISPAGGSYTGLVSVTMQTATSGASIYYTADGSSPTPLSTLYTGAITLASSAVVKAKAFKSGYIASTESSAAFTVTTPLITTWTFCALENSQCSFSGTKEVRYGINGVYVSQIFTDGVFCDNNIFGDPVFGWGKQCEYRDVNNQPTAATSTSQPFSFSLSNAGNKSVVAGSAVSNSIAAALVSGSSQSVSFSVSGLPSGAVGSFSSTSCNPTCSTLLNITTTGSTPAGNFPITVTSSGGGLTKTTAFTLGVTLALTSTTPTSGGTGKTYFVAKTGSNSNSCAQAQSESTPKLTIAAGVACLSSSDTLTIKAGTYAESFTSAQFIGKSGTSYSNATTIQAFGSDVVTARGVSFYSPGTGNAIRYIIFKNIIFDAAQTIGTVLQFGSGGNGGTIDHIKLDGVDAFNPTGGGGSGYIVTTGGGDGVGTDIWITNSKLRYTTPVCGTPFVGGGLGRPIHAAYISSPNNLIEHTEIYGATGYGIHNYSGNSSGNIYRFNYIHNNGDNGPCAGQTAWGLLLATGNNNQVYGNLVINNQQGISVTTDNNVVYNNTVYGSGGASQYSAMCCYEAIRIDGGDGNVVKNNIVFSNAANRIMDNGTGSFISNNLTTDPKFVNASSNDFRLQSSSAAIDTGANLAPTVIADYSGVSMPQGCCYDIGAYEY